MNKLEDIINPQPAMSVSAIQQGLVSIITPNYNGGRLLHETLDSVLAQTYQNWEMIVVDDGSTDDSIDILEQYSQADARIRYIPLLQNSGTPAVPRNRGIDNANGEFIAFLDADDLWHPQKLEIQINFLQENSANLCFTYIFPFLQESEYNVIQRQIMDPEDMPTRRLTHSKLLFKNIIKSGSSVVLRYSILDDMRFDEDPKYRAIEDYLFWLYLHQYKIDASYLLKDYLVGYRLSETSISKSKLFMIRQNWRAYRNYRINSRSLGLKIIVYFATYVIISLRLVMKYKLVRMTRALQIKYLKRGRKIRGS